MKLPSHLTSGFFRVNFTMGFSTLARQVAGLAKVKFSALLLGTAGVGIIGLGGQLQLLGVTLASLSLSSGFIRKLSAAIEKGDTGAQSKLISTVFTLQVIANLILILSVIIFHGVLLPEQFASAEKYIIPIAVAIPAHCFIVTYLNGIYYSYQWLRIHTIISVVSTFVEVIAFISFVYFFGLRGALWGLALGIWTWAILLFLFSFKKIPANVFLKFRIDKRLTLELIAAGFVLTASGVIAYSTQAGIRVLLIQKLGTHDNGIYQVVISLFSYYAPFLTNAVWIHLFPKLSAQGLNIENRREWMGSMYYMAILAGAIQISIISYSSHVVSILYSKEFQDAVGILPIQVLGDFFFIFSQPTISALLAFSYNKSYLAVQGIYYLSLYLLSSILVGKFGLIGASYAYLAASLALVIFSLSTFFIMVKDREYRFFVGSIFIFSISILCFQLFLHERWAGSPYPYIFWFFAILVLGGMLLKKDQLQAYWKKTTQP